MKHIAPISGVSAFQSAYVATAGYDNQVILWDALTHLAISKSNHDHLANMCVFSPDGTLLASASSDYSARIWEVPTMRLRTVLAGHSDDVEMVSFSPDGRKIATCSRDHTIRIYQIEGTFLTSCIGHQADVISVAWMPDSKELVSSSDDGTVRSWDAETGHELKQVSFEGVETDTIAITTDGLIFAGDDEGRISLLRGGDVVQKVKGHDAGIKRLVYSERAGQLVSLSYDRKMRLWSRDGDAIFLRLEADLPNIVWPRSCAFVGSSKIAFATFGSTYAVFDVGSETWEGIGYVPSVSVNAVLSVNGDIFTVGDAGIVRKNNSPVADMDGLCNFIATCGDRLITGGQMGRILNAQTGETIYQHRSPLNCACSYTKDGTPYAAVGAYTGEVIIIRETPFGLEFVKSIKAHDNAIKGVANDGHSIFAVSANRNAATIDIPTLEVTDRWDAVHNQIANGCASIGIGSYCSVSRDLNLRVWRDGKIEVVPSPHKNSSKCVAAAGDLVAAGDYGGRIAIYSLGKRSWYGMVRPSTAGISSLSYCGTSNCFLASCYDGHVYEVGLDDTPGKLKVSTRLNVPLSAGVPM